MKTNRRKFLKLTATGGLAIVAAGSVVTWFSIEPNREQLSTSSVIALIDQLFDTDVTSCGQWDPYSIFMHCAQSVDYSIDGYPEHRSALFKSVAGKLAFSLFSEKRKMSHNLAEVIPGAPKINPNGDVNVALNTLRSSLIRFENFNGDLQAHYAYGELNKQQYELAHAMHFLNHLKEVAFKS